MRRCRRYRSARAHLGDSAIDAGPVLVAEHAGAQMTLVDAADRRNHAKRELLARHFHAEHGDRGLVSNRRVFRDVERERGLAHGRAAGDDHEIAGLQPRGHLVEIGIAAAHARELPLRLVQQVERSIVAPRTSRSGTKPEPVRLPCSAISNTRRSASSTSSVAGLTFARVRAARDFSAHADQVPERRTLADDVRVRRDIGGGRGIARQAAEIGQSAGLLAKALGRQPFGERDGVAGSLLRRARDRRRSAGGRAGRNRRVGGGRQSRPTRCYRAAASKHGLFGLEGVRRHTQRVVSERTVARLRKAAPPASASIVDDPGVE